VPKSPGPPVASQGVGGESRARLTARRHAWPTAHRDLGPEWLATRNEEAHTRRLVAQLEKLGHTVLIDPAA
jgi:hypothetical protein